MPKPKYPEITDTTLVPFRAIEVQLEANPDLLDAKECPYPPHIKELLRRLLPSQAAPAVKVQTEDDLLQEISDLYDELRHTNVGGEPKDQVQLIKTRADLLSRLVDLKAKGLSLRDISRFQRAVITAIEEFLTPAQRNEFIERLNVR